MRPLAWVLFAALAGSVLLLGTPPRAADGATVRVFRNAAVLVTSSRLDADTLRRATDLAERVRELFPSHWKAATRGLSIMEFTPLETLADDGTLLYPGGELRIDDATALFYRTHADDYDLITFFHVHDGCCMAYRTYQLEMTGLGWNRQVGTESIGGMPPGVPGGATRLLGAAQILMSAYGLSIDQPAWQLMPVMLHEFHHQWCCYTLAPASTGLDDWALTDGHWNTLLYLPTRPKYPMIGGDASMGGWTDHGDWTYTLECIGPDATEPGRYAFPSYALYLMGLLSADDADGIAYLRSPDPMPDCRSATPLRVSGQPVEIPLAALIERNGYAARVTPPRDRVSPTAGSHAVAYASAEPLAVAVGDTRWAWVALRNTGTELLSRNVELVVGEGSSFAEGLEGVEWVATDVPGRLMPILRTGEVDSIGFRVRATTAGTYKLLLHARDRYTGAWLGASWVIVFNVLER